MKCFLELMSPIIPVYWFDERTNVGIRLHLYPKDEYDSWRLNHMRKLNSYTGGKFKYFIIWQTRKMESLFKLKDHN